MASPDRDERPDADTILLETLDDPERGKERLPYVVGLFESGDQRTRLCAAWTCCLVATETDDEDTIEYLVRRLSDRLDDEHVSLELTTTLDYISTCYSEQVEAVLDEMAEEEQEIPLPRVGNFTRNHYYDSEPEREGVGRTRIASGPQDEDPRRAYSDTEREEREQVEYERERDAKAETDAGDGTDDEAAEEADAEDGGLGAPMAEQRTEVASIAARSRFDKLHILASRQRDRYADIYEALVGSGGEEKAVALRLFRRPDGNASRLTFADKLRPELRRWNAIDDHGHVVTIQDWGVEPRPWVVTMFTGETLAERGNLDFEYAVTTAVNLAGAVSHAHQNDVVHGGIDAQNVVYPGEVLDDDAQHPPMLDNVGLLNAYRFHFEPALCLDARYAAPEYFDRQYGRIDHATDIYQLGAVLYRMFTGKPPFSGEFADVRRGVLEEEPTPPSQTAADVPVALDEIVAKALAKQKLRRYETVEHLEGDLASLAGGEEDG